MTGIDIVVDTNIIITLLNGNDGLADYLFNLNGYISVITEVELLGFHSLTNEDIAKINELLLLFQKMEFSNLIQKNTIAIRRQHRIKLPDAIIAATALTLDIPLLTFDKAFTKVDGLQVVVPQV